MPAKPTLIEHLGRIDAVTPNDIRVVIISQSACASCHAKGACSASDVSEKIVVVSKTNHNFLVGETVKVLLKQSLGFKALFLAYILPFIVVITALFSLSSFVSEGIAGILALLSLIPYYAILYFFKNKISKQFNFDIEKIS
ncbi:MAG TPA: SoxR reducing system RseC family protein [Tenuifilaceae bacterium]|nr:SoxR reducing system RseC family protein [Tenuifilaceae bacterium]HPN23097.1 SoxR reducing system RseC family protein [Tenuifilaceae bacterium]HPV57239.1 SoxR reducing system RseC family protein [Tenuifilaceae bacterium]